MLKSIDELWFSLHFSCLSNKILNCRISYVESESMRHCASTMLFPSCNTVPCLVCVVNFCSFGTLFPYPFALEHSSDLLTLLPLC